MYSELTSYTKETPQQTIHKRRVGKSTIRWGRWREDAVALLGTRAWKTAAKDRESCRQRTG